MQAFGYMEMKIYQHDDGHMTTKMAAIPIYGKTSSSLEPISTRLGVYHRGLMSIMICSNGEPRLTLPYFKVNF